MRKNGVKLYTTDPEICSIFITFKGLSFITNCLRPESAPLNRMNFVQQKNFVQQVVKIVG